MEQVNLLWRSIEGVALFLYHRIVSRTVRWRIEGKSNLSLARASKRPLLWAYWHEQVSPFIMYGDRFIGGSNFCVVMVGDVRADILGMLGVRLGAETYAIDMRGNPMASGRSLLRVIQAMKRGKQSMLAPDGPDGPPFVPKPGVAFLAQKAEAAVIPVGIYAAPSYRLKRWDRYQVPLPFATLHTVFGPPLLADRQTASDTLLAEISSALNAARRQAQLNAGVEPWP